MAQHCERRAVESQQRRLVDAAERIDEQRGPEPAQVQHDRRLLRRSRHFSGEVDRALRIGAQVKRGGERARQRMRIEILRIVRAGVRFARPLPGAERALQLGGHRRRRRRASTAGSAASDLRDCARTTASRLSATRSRHRGVRARAQRAALAHRCNQRARIEVALRHQHAERVADRESDQRAFVARRDVELRNRARDRLAPAQHEVDLLGRFPESTASCANARIASTAPADARGLRRSAVRCESDGNRRPCRCGRCRRGNARTRSGPRRARRRSGRESAPCAPASRARCDRAIGRRR